MACFVGIDGCRAGWFAVSLFEDQSWELIRGSGLRLTVACAVSV